MYLLAVQNAKTLPLYLTPFRQLESSFLVKGFYVLQGVRVPQLILGILLRIFQWDQVIKFCITNHYSLFQSHEDMYKGIAFEKTSII